MPRWQKPVWRTTRIPVRVVERIHGKGNFDDAADDLVHALRLVSDFPDQHRYRFEFDTTHPNPWYHTMIFKIEGISDSSYERFVDKVAALGLSEASGTTERG